MKSPALTLPGAMDALLALSKSVGHGELPRQVLELTNLRASQINGCSVCVEMHARSLKKMGEADERIFATAAWRESPYYTEAERAALALAEAVTRLADRPHPVPDDVWNEAARHYSQAALAALVLSLGVVNMWNRLNAATQQMSGPWTAQHV
jgi:AhpD family alkylhydroperoxidase